LLQRPELLRAVEAEFSRTRLAALTYSDALAIFAALWREARAVNPELIVDWLEDLQPDFAIARASNGLPPRA
jgi:hypothetical protein